MRASSFAFASLILAGTVASAEVTRTLKAELTDPSRPFRVENLAGRMTVRQGSGGKVVVTATVHGADQKTADLLKLQEVRDAKTGLPTLRVIYPVADHTTYRYGRNNGSSGGGFFDKMFSGMSSNNTTYDGVRVSVSSGRGLELYADVVVEIPRGVTGTFKNSVGAIEGSGVDGTLKFDSSSGDIALSDFKGEVSADTGSGDVTATSGRGIFKCDTGSGDCLLNSFTGERIDLDTGSGDINVTGASARFVSADTGSGSIELDVDDAEDVETDTGSGDVTLDLGGSKLSRISADTGSGDVSLKLPRSIGFEMKTDVGSGDVSSDFDDATAIMQRRKVKGYRRGDLQVKIAVDTGSGDVSVGPGRF